MADFKQSYMGLEYSKNFDIQGMQEADVDLNLSLVIESFATVYGTVTDGTNPIPDATVKLFDSKGIPFKHTLTDTEGEYSMDGVPVGTYSIGTVKSGYRLSDAVGVTLSANDTTAINFACTADATLALGAVAGVLVISDREDQKAPLANAKISMMNSNNKVVATTYTVDDGEFAFYDVEDGKYTLLSSADGYLPSSPMTVTITGGSIVNILLSMSVDTRTYNGTVSGIIRGNNGNAVADCFVGLYQITNNEDGTKSEKMISVTKTNTAGKYLFGNVKSGQYLVKAKMDK